MPARVEDFDRFRFARWLDAEGWSCAALARATGLFRETVSTWLNGKRLPSEDAYLIVLEAIRDPTNYEPCRHCKGTGRKPKESR